MSLAALAVKSYGSLIPAHASLRDTLCVFIALQICKPEYFVACKVCLLLANVNIRQNLKTQKKRTDKNPQHDPI